MNFILTSIVRFLLISSVFVDANKQTPNYVLEQKHLFRNKTCAVVHYHIQPYESEHLYLPYAINDYIKISMANTLCMNITKWKMKISGIFSHFFILRKPQQTIGVANDDQEFTLFYQFGDVLSFFYKCEIDMRNYFISIMQLNYNNFTNISIGGDNLTMTYAQRIDINLKIVKQSKESAIINNSEVDSKTFINECHHVMGVLFYMVTGFFGSGILYVIVMIIYDNRKYFMKIKCFKKKTDNRVCPVVTMRVNSPDRVQINFD